MCVPRHLYIHTSGAHTSRTCTRADAHASLLNNAHNIDVAISNVQISLIFPGLEFLVRTNVRVSGDSARRALSNGVCNAIYD